MSKSVDFEDNNIMFTALNCKSLCAYFVNSVALKKINEKNENFEIPQISS